MNENFGFSLPFFSRRFFKQAKRKNVLHKCNLTRFTARKTLWNGAESIQNFLFCVCYCCYSFLKFSFSLRFEADAIANVTIFFCVFPFLS